MRKVLKLLLLSFWAVSLSAVVSTLMANHWATLPHPEEGHVLPLPIEEASGQFGDQVNQVGATYHFLYSNCRCSQRVVEHLLNRKPVENAGEQVVLVGADSKLEAKILRSGYRLVVVTEAELKARYDVEAAPLMVITDTLGTIKYSGGYSSKRQGLDYQDVEIINKVFAGEKLEGLPVYGCAVSTRLQDIVDPLGIKY